MMRLLLNQRVGSSAVWRQTLARKSGFSTATARRATEIPVPPPKPKKRHRIRNFFLTTTLSVGGTFAGAVWYSSHDDNFYYYFTTYVPMAGFFVDSIEDMVFRANMRGPNPKPAFKPHNPAPASEIINVTGDDKANALPASDEVSIAGNKIGKAQVKTEQLAHNVKESKPAKKVEHAIEKAAEPSKPRKKESAGPKTDTGVPLTSARPAKVVPVGGSVGSGPSGSSADAYPRMSIETDGSDPAVAESADTLNASLQAHGIDLDKNAVFASLAESVKHASDGFKQERAASRQEREQASSQQRTDIESKIDQEYVNAKLNLVESYNKRSQLALDAITQKAVLAANNKLAAQNVEMTEYFAREINNLVEQERDGRLSQLAELKKDVETSQEAMSSSGQILESEDGVVAFFVELANSQRVLTSEKTVPLQPYLDSSRRSSPSDPLVRAVYDSVSPSVKKYGVLSHPQLAARFKLIEPEIRRASLVPPDAGIAGHLGSLAASQLLARKEGLPAGEDVESILARTQTYSQQGDVSRAVAEVNSSQGWPKRIAGDWLDEGRKRGEMEFLVNVLSDEGRLWSVSRK